MGKLTGNDPEMDPLDANLFADYKKAIKDAVAYTSHCDNDHPEKYSLRTANEVRKTMKRVWAWAPTSERIVQDISRWPAHLQRVFDADGAKVPKKKRGKRPRTKEFQPPPDCPLAKAALREHFRVLDPTSLPPKKRPRSSRA